MELTNFRPISVLPVLSKILERVVHDQLVSHLLKFNLLSDRQSGFRPKHSTQDVCCTLLIVGVTPLMKVNLLQLLSKAFDSVNHDILLLKLACMIT